MSIQIVNELDETRWREFVDQHPQGNIFHTPEMFKVYARAKGYYPSLWAAVEGDRILALHLPVQVTLMGGPLAPFTTRAIGYGSVLVEHSERGQQALGELMAVYNTHHGGWALFTELRNFADLRWLQEPLARHGYLHEDHEDYLIDLHRNQYDILQSFSSGTRKRIRRNQRSGELVVRELTDPALLPVFYQLLKKTYQRVRLPLADISLFQAAFDVLVPRKMARFTLAFANGMPVAGCVDIQHRDVMFGWYNGVDRSVPAESPNEYLLWEGISWGAENGYRIMDLGGAGRPGEKYGVRDFKSKFNGQLVNYGRYSCVHSVFRLALSGRVFHLARKAGMLVSGGRPERKPPAEKDPSGNGMERSAR